MSKKHVTLAELAQYLKAEFQGDPECLIQGVASLDAAEKGDVVFFYDPRYRDVLASTHASAIILSHKDLEYAGVHRNLIIAQNPRLAFAKIAVLFQAPSFIAPGIHPTAVIGECCSISSTASIGPHCVIGDHAHIGEGTVLGPGCVLGESVTIGDVCWLWPNATLYHDVKIGDRVIIHSGAVLGSDGFGFENENGTWYKIPQLGGVQVGDDVEIGANTTIDRGALNDTVIESGVKLDNQIQIGHNVIIGAHSIIAGCVAIAGGVRIGKNVMVGGKVGIAGHLEIADRVILTAGTHVHSSILNPGIYSSGIPAHPNLEWRKNAVRFTKLDDMARRLRKLEKREGILS